MTNCQCRPSINKGTHRFFDVSIRLMYQENRRIDSNHDSTGRRIDTIMIRLGGKSILSWFGWAENRYYHDSAKRRIDTIMIRLGGESILLWFSNTKKNRFESKHKIIENQENRFKSILSTEYRCESILLWAMTKCWPKTINQTQGAYCIVLCMYRTVPYRTVNRLFFVTKSIRTVPYLTVRCCTIQKPTYHTVPILYMYRAIITRIKLAR